MSKLFYNIKIINQFSYISIILILSSSSINCNYVDYAINNYQPSTNQLPVTVSTTCNIIESIGTAIELGLPLVGSGTGLALSILSTVNVCLTIPAGLVGCILGIIGSVVKGIPLLVPGYRLVAYGINFLVNCILGGLLSLLSGLFGGGGDGGITTTTTTTTTGPINGITSSSSSSSTDFF
ncbi:uncharacterized protein LOC128965259 [Oppia nitens]|uniref:uncharacterized protein LOC128965259 n=1 Tax=Oppia nitens TaxID=1686743 RepID=UPI0023DA9A3B|nr:uncharacterized protein LOC128965259 [Oppia nitens]